MSLFLCLSYISLGQYCRKSLDKSGEFEKKKKKNEKGDRLIFGGGRCL